MKSVVIGSGFGGIAAALRLKAKNYDVTLVEKHKDLGGRARVFKKNGFIFDGGPTVITAPYLIDELFELFNKKSQDYIKLTPLKTWYRFIFEDGMSFDYSGNEDQMKNQIEKINKEDVKGYENLVKFTKKIFDKGFTELADVPFDKSLIMIKQLPSLLKLKSYKSVYSLVSSYIKNEKLRRMLSMHPLLVGGNPFTTTSIYGLILYLEKKWGIHYSMGGTGNIIKGLEKLMLEEKIELIKGHEVTKIISLNNKIQGVKLDNQKEIRTNNVICNADPPAVYEKLLNKSKFSSLFKWKKKRMEYSMGLFVYYFGTKKTYNNVEHHTIKFGDKYKEHLDDIFDKKKLNDDISYYLHRPSATDKSMAPEGHDCFYVLVPVPNNQSEIDWSIEGDRMKNLIIDKMEKNLLPNLKENIVEDFYLTPDYFEKELNTKFGSGFSIQPKFTQSAYFRFHNKSEICDGLYFVGAGTHPGAGVPGVLSSAKVLDKIL
ncbi:phytoene desaturase family protein [Candidatus Pelagibacter sp.]|nr:phytoene desaturase family protein [Candidatus Pelagibacter sp.]